MRIALCFSGQIRSYKKSYEYYKQNLLDYHNVDVFIHTWDIPESDFDELDRLYKPRVIETRKDFPSKQFDRYPKLDNQEWDRTWPTRNKFQQFYSVFKSNEFKKEYELDNGFRYDVVIRTRFDFALNRKLDFTINKKKLYVPKDKVLGDIEPNQDLCNDQFAYGSSEIMDLYSQTFWFLEKLYSLGSPGPGENILAYNLKMTGLSGNLIHVDMNHPFRGNNDSLIRDDVDQWREKNRK